MNDHAPLPTVKTGQAEDAALPAVSLAIAIVNYRTPELVVDCLQALDEQLDLLPPVRVWVVDNASGDNSQEILTDARDFAGCQDWLRLLFLQDNGGFAAGNNAALREEFAAREPPEFVLLLNSDTVPRPGAVASLLAFMREHPEIGIAGSRLEDSDGTPQRSAFRFHGVLNEFESGLRLGLVSRLLHRHVVAPPVEDAPHAADWVAGASMIIRREVFDAIGLLDESYFLYFEEVDFCLRARRAGWPTWYVPDSRVVHLVGKSSGVTSGERRRVPPYWFASRRLYFRKNFGLLRATAADITWAMGRALNRVRCAIQGKPREDPPYLLRDFLRYNFVKPAPASPK